MSGKYKLEIEIESFADDGEPFSVVDMLLDLFEYGRETSRCPTEYVRVLAAEKVEFPKPAAWVDYDTWVDLVDKEVWNLVDLSIHDLADVQLMDWYEDETPAAEAARKAIAESGFDVS